MYVCMFNLDCNTYQIIFYCLISKSSFLFLLWFMYKFEPAQMYIKTFYTSCYSIILKCNTLKSKKNTQLLTLFFW